MRLRTSEDDRTREGGPSGAERANQTSAPSLIRQLATAKQERGVGCAWRHPLSVSRRRATEWTRFHPTHDLRSAMSSRRKPVLASCRIEPHHGVRLLATTATTTHSCASACRCVHHFLFSITLLNLADDLVRSCSNATCECYVTIND